MASVNKAIIVGNLGRDPEMRTTQGGTQVANFSVATSDRFKDQSGEWQERTEWHRIVAFGRTAEICGQYLSKGRSVYIEGAIRTNKWEDKEGQTRYTTEIICNNMQMLGGRGEGGGSGGGGGGMTAAAGQGGGGANLSADDEDLPF
jgi:single-strand DNA-binding protein